MKIHSAYRTIWFWAGVGTLLFSVWYIFFSLPRPLIRAPYSTVLVDSEKQLLSARVARDGQWRFPVVDSLSEKYTAAVITFEDKRFYTHGGVDLLALGRAARDNLLAGRIVSGGSTITMQLIRIASDNPPRTVYQKLREILLATRLEWSASKKHILQLYASHAPFGGNVVGIEAAAWRYFGKPSTRISWAEAALLAVLPNNPAMLHPGRGRAPLKTKRDRLLTALHQRGILDGITLETALAEPIPPTPLPLPDYTPHLTDRIISERPSAKAAIVHTTIEGALQSKLNTLAQQHHRRLSGRGIHNLAVLVMHVPTGQIHGYVGNAPRGNNAPGSAVDVIRAPRSTGSILKPFLFASAIQEGHILTKSFLPDHPVNYNGYRPQNYGLTYSGAIPADRALIRSLNVPFIQLLHQFGTEPYYQQLKQLGLSTLHYAPDHYGLTLILGGAEARLDEITASYAFMARTLNRYLATNGRYLPEPPPPRYSFLQGHSLADAQHSLSKNLVDRAPLYRAGAIWKTFETMRRVERPDTRGGWENFRSSRHIAWKTGTSFGFRDAWAIGVTPEYAIGVWVGNADGEGRPNLIGIQAAGPLLFDAFEMLPPTSWWPPPYDDLVYRSICSASGDLAGPYCQSTESLEAVSIRGGHRCTYHQRMHINREGTFQVDQSCYPSSQIQHQNMLVLPPRMAYYYRNDHPDWQPIPPIHPDCRDIITDLKVMQLIYPQEPRRILVPRNGDGSWSRTVFELAHQRPDTKVFWHLDDQFIGTTETFHVMELNPPPGPHLLTLIDEAGNRLRQPFDIRRTEPIQ